MSLIQLWASSGPLGLWYSQDAWLPPILADTLVLPFLAVVHSSWRMNAIVYGLVEDVKCFYMELGEVHYNVGHK